MDGSMDCGQIKRREWLLNRDGKEETKIAEGFRTDQPCRVHSPFCTKQQHATFSSFNFIFSGIHSVLFLHTFPRPGTFGLVARVASADEALLRHLRLRKARGPSRRSAWNSKRGVARQIVLKLSVFYFMMK